MHLKSTFQLAQDSAATFHMPIKQYLIENRSHFLNELFSRQLFVNNRLTGVEMIKPADITLCSANQILFAPRKTVAQHQQDKGVQLQHTNLSCIAVKRSTSHYDYFPVETVFYVTA